MRNNCLVNLGSISQKKSDLDVFVQLFSEYHKNKKIIFYRIVWYLHKYCILNVLYLYIHDMNF